jgi:TfoX/Sxy family transcriptional regulator of competence genes
MTESVSYEELMQLKALLDGALAGLENVVPKRLFGCDGWFVQGNIFAMVWKEGRLGFRLSDPELQAEAMAFKGAEPWSVGRQVMKHWVLVPKGWHREPAKLKAWGRKAHAVASARPEQSKVTGKKNAIKTVKPAVFKILSKTKRG